MINFGGWGFAAAVRFVIVLVGSFQPLIHSLSVTPLPTSDPTPFSPLSYLFSRLYKALNNLNNEKTTTQSIFEDHREWSLRFCGVTASSEEGCLNTLRLFSLGGELALIFFSLWKNRHKIKVIFHRFVENKSVHPDLGPPSRIFALTFFTKFANDNSPYHKTEGQNSRPILLSSQKAQSGLGWMDTSTFWNCSKQIFLKAEIKGVTKGVKSC